MSKKEDIERKKKIQELKKAREEAGNQTARTLSKATEQRDLEQETQTAKRYKKVGVSPIYSRGVFTAKSNINENNKITEDDKVDELKKKKKK